MDPKYPKATWQLQDTHRSQPTRKAIRSWVRGAPCKPQPMLSRLLPLVSPKSHLDLPRNGISAIKELGEMPRLHYFVRRDHEVPSDNRHTSMDFRPQHPSLRTNISPWPSGANSDTCHLLKIRSSSRSCWKEFLGTLCLESKREFSTLLCFNKLSSCMW